MSLRKQLAKNHPSLLRKQASKQYELSKAIIGRKLEMKLDQRAMAALLEIPYNEYLEMESGSVEIDLKVYQDALSKLSKH